MPLSDFELREKIGEGGFGIVYRARQPSLDRDVALKVVHPRHAESPGFTRRFQAEARLVARIEHPNVVPLYEFGIDDGTPYLAMRLMEGGSLADALRRGPSKPEAARRMLLEVAGGLSVAHHRGVVHADLKPSNILFDRDGTAYVSDFGIAVDLFGDSQAATGGSPAYMAPETLTDGALDERADVYALAIVLAEALSGHHPFGDLDMQGMVEAQLTQDVALPADVPSEVSRATSKDPAGRPADAAALVAALEGWTTASVGVAPRRTPLPARYSSFVGREEEMLEIRRLLSDRRLVTVTGVGGIGKSSLAVEGVRAVQDAFDVTYVDVESVQAGDVAVAIARAMGLLPSSAENAERLIARVTSRHPSLLLLDGSEHVVEALAGLVDRLLRASAELRVVVTTREPLYIPGESVIFLNPLEAGAHSPAVELFVDRAGLAGRLTPEDLTAIEQICDELDGIPLAVELAAGRARSLPIDEVVSRLDRQLELLVDRRGSRDRHASIVATLDWSYRLLAKDRQSALRALSAFRGGFERDAAAFLLDRPDAPDVLADLSGASLLVAPQEGSRFHMLEPIRQYAWSLAEAAGETDGLRRRHADWAVGLARQTRDGRSTDRHRQVLERIALEHDEVLSALRWSIVEDGTHAVDIVADLGRHWYANGVDEELRDLMYRAVEHSGIQPSAQLAIATAHTGFSWQRYDRLRGQELIERAVAMARDSDDDAAVGMALTRLSAHVAEGDGDWAKALEIEREAFELLQRSGHPDAWGESYNLAQNLALNSRLREAEEVVRVAPGPAGDPIRAAAPELVAMHGEMLFATGEFDRGISLVSSGASALLEAGRFWLGGAHALALAVMHTLLGHHVEARTHIDEVMSTVEVMGIDLPRIDSVVEAVVDARAAAARGDTVAAMQAIRNWLHCVGPVLQGDAHIDTAWGVPPLLRSAPGRPSCLLMLAGPMAVAAEDPAVATTIVGTALAAMEADDYDLWQETGEIDRLQQLLDDAESAHPLMDEDELCRYAASVFGG